MSNAKTQTLERTTFGDRLIRLVFWSRRLHRLLYPSPAEVTFIRLMKGHVLVVPFIHSSRNKFPLAVVLSMGYLKRELVEREVWAGGERRFCMDFATPNAAYRKCIEIDGSQHDIVKDQERDDYLHGQGWEIMRIPARRIWREPRLVYVETIKFLRT